MKIAIPLFFGLDILVIDLMTKYLAANHLPEAIWVIPKYFSFEYHQNPGLAFSIPMPTIFQILLSILLLTLLFFYFQKKTKGRFEIFFVISIFAGAIGNLVERILFGHVTDFISVWKFPVFNVADIAIFLGVVGLVFFEIQQTKRDKKNPSLHKK